MLYPKPLKAGSRIAIISPAGAVSNPDFLLHTDKMIKDNGYKPVYGKYYLEKYDHYYNYAGTIEQRLSDIQWAFDDDSIDAIWATRGGYGCVQLLNKINLKKFLNNPKWYIGYSDNTYMQSLLARNNIASIHGQNVIRTINPTDISYENIFKMLKGEIPNYSINNNILNKEGTVKGSTLIGGNLTCVCALMGSKYNFNYENAVLFIEEIGENAYYKLDRYIKSLEDAGLLDKIKGVIVGGMKNIAEVSGDYNQTAYEVIYERLANYNMPQIYGFPNGHISDMRPLILGSTVEIKVNEELSYVNFLT